MTSKLKRSHGGARPGAGRKPLSETEPTVRRTVTMPKSLADYLTQIGGTFSKGVRIAAEFYKEHHEERG